jgi:hypothetical protein
MSEPPTPSPKSSNAPSPPNPSRHHHRVVHEGHWQLHAGEAGGFCFVDPRGEELPARPPVRPSSERAVRHLRINADTIPSPCSGERLNSPSSSKGSAGTTNTPPPGTAPLQN